MANDDRSLDSKLKEGIAELSLGGDRKDFVEPSYIEQIVSKYSELSDTAEARSKKILFKLGLGGKDLRKDIAEFREAYEQFPGKVHDHNRRLAESRSSDIGAAINPVEDRDLDRQQLTCIAMDVDTRLVIAGAGTGKTTTIVGLVKYLLKQGLAQPEEILLLSFTNASVNELKDRIMKETSERIDTTTFHRLGLRIIAITEGKTPNITHTDLNQFVTDELQSKISDTQFLRDLNNYLAYEFNSQIDELAFANNADYVRYLRENPLITLNGEKVKSTGEADIANYLAMNGIPYVYEDAYCVDTSDSEHGRYYPDFHIVGTDIYIEYFGIDRSGNVAKFMIDEHPDASEKYKEGMEWKRETHAENNTRLIELFYYEKAEGTLFDKLEEKLGEYNIGANPVPAEEIFQKTLGNDKMKFSTIASSITTAIILMKGYGKPWDAIYPRSENKKVQRSLDRMAAILKPIYIDYLNELAANDEIDFEDMLSMAADCVRRGYEHPYKYVIVDEYQDISRSRFELLKAMRDSKRYRLFCVGDDWQSIYRFNGSDVSYILDFEKYWGPSEICKIETTYRFSGELLEKSSAFITRNPRQVKKNLVGKAPSECRIIALFGATEDQAFQKVKEELHGIPDSETVLFLGRYRHDIVRLGDIGLKWTPNLKDGSFVVTSSERPDLKMTYMTIHGSKGLQASRVFILNNKTGGYGFPSIREENPLIPLLLNSRDSQLDEERRLFYVAMTRAKKRLYLVAFRNRESRFYKEIVPAACPHVAKGVPLICPWCGGDMVLRKGSHGSFYGCSNFPKTGCKYTVQYTHESPSNPPNSSFKHR